jgi:hypothetical protein
MRKRIGEIILVDVENNKTSSYSGNWTYRLSEQNDVTFLDKEVSWYW